MSRSAGYTLLCQEWSCSGEGRHKMMEEHAAGRNQMHAAARRCYGHAAGSTWEMCSQHRRPPCNCQQACRCRLVSAAGCRRRASPYWRALATSGLTYQDRMQAWHPLYCPTPSTICYEPRMALRLVIYVLAALYLLCDCHHLISSACHSTALRKEVPVGTGAELRVPSASP